MSGEMYENGGYFTEVLRAVESAYGVRSLQAEKTALGTADCFVICTEQSKIFVKIYLKKYDCEQISKEIMICERLRAKGMCVSEYLKNKVGEYINTAAFGRFTVQKFIDGTTYGKFQVPEQTLLQSAEILADIHTGLADIPNLKEDFSKEWIDSGAEIDKHVKKVEAIIQMTEEMPDHGLKDRILEDCRWRLQSVHILPELKNNFEGLTRKNSHGDYNTYQWICENEKIKAVIDFGSCGNLPVIWELVRSYTYAGKECRGGNGIDVNLYCEYVRHYLRKNELNSTDLQQGFTFYFYSLFMSTFGYKEYVEDYKRNKYNPLIEFALWRTQMCRYLYKNASSLDRAVNNEIYSV